MIQRQVFYFGVRYSCLNINCWEMEVSGTVLVFPSSLLFRHNVNLIFEIQDLSNVTKSMSRTHYRKSERKELNLAAHSLVTAGFKILIIALVRVIHLKVKDHKPTL